MDNGMFFIEKSYDRGYRVFVNRLASPDLHFWFKRDCIWGGADKNRVVDGVEYLGYEYANIDEATTALKRAADQYFSLLFGRDS
jgi:hypothetical protein